MRYLAMFLVLGLLAGCIWPGGVGGWGRDGRGGDHGEYRR
jgi:hypothetical protein